MIGWLAVDTASVPEDDAWLCGTEPQVLAGLRVPKRHDEWRSGRWAAKHAVAAVLGVVPGDVEVRADDDGAPHALCGNPLPVGISISHRAGVAVCTVVRPAAPVGCDLEVVEPRAPVFVADWFTAAERRRVGAAGDEARDLLVTATWSAKESALKALGSGLRRDTRSVEVEIDERDGVDGWRRLAVQVEDGRVMAGWWRRHRGMVLTVAGASCGHGRPLPVAVGPAGEEE